MGLALSVLFAIGSMLGFGLADFIAKAILTRSNIYRTLLISQSVGTVPFLALALSYGNLFPGQSIFLLDLLCGVLSAFIMLTFYSALRLGKATIVSSVSGCISAFAVVLSVIVLEEKLTLVQMLLVAAIFCGILLVAFDKTDEASSSSSRLSIVLALVVVVLGGLNVIIQKWIAVSHNILSSFAIVRLSMAGSLAMLFPFSCGHTSLHETRKGYLVMGLLGLIDASAFFSLFMGFKTGFVSIVAPVANSGPIVTIILARIFLNERVQFRQKIGVITIIVCVVILSAIA